ncbi:MAG: hypothetical protein ACI9GM_000913 [Salibacteraceae bacterium]|jgi:hypothetical protein
MRITDVLGNYLVEGANQNEEETKYEGSLILSLRADGRLNAVWQIDPDQMQYGIGFFKNEMLVINFYYVGDNDAVFRGVVAYNCSNMDTLAGIWSEEAGDSKYVGVETAHKIQPEFLN